MLPTILLSAFFVHYILCCGMLFLFLTFELRIRMTKDAYCLERYFIFYGAKKVPEAHDLAHLVCYKRFVLHKKWLLSSREDVT